MGICRKLCTGLAGVGGKRGLWRHGGVLGILLGEMELDPGIQRWEKINWWVWGIRTFQAERTA
jgi:hypothetical protein